MSTKSPAPPSSGEDQLSEAAHHRTNPSESRLSDQANASEATNESEATISEKEKLLLVRQAILKGLKNESPMKVRPSAKMELLQSPKMEEDKENDLLLVLGGAKNLKRKIGSIPDTIDMISLPDKQSDSESNSDRPARATLERTTELKLNAAHNPTNPTESRSSGQANASQATNEIKATISEKDKANDLKRVRQALLKGLDNENLMKLRPSAKTGQELTGTEHQTAKWTQAELEQEASAGKDDSGVAKLLSEMTELAQSLSQTCSSLPKELFTTSGAGDTPLQKVLENLESQQTQMDARIGELKKNIEDETANLQREKESQARFLETDQKLDPHKDRILYQISQQELQKIGANVAARQSGLDGRNQDLKALKEGHAAITEAIGILQNLIPLGPAVLQMQAELPRLLEGTKECHELMSKENSSLKRKAEESSREEAKSRRLESDLTKAQEKLATRKKQHASLEQAVQEENAKSEGLQIELTKERERVASLRSSLDGVSKATEEAQKAAQQAVKATEEAQKAAQNAQQALDENESGGI